MGIYTVQTQVPAVLFPSFRKGNHCPVLEALSEGEQGWSGKDFMFCKFKCFTIGK